MKTNYEPKGHGSERELLWALLNASYRERGVEHECMHCGEGVTIERYDHSPECIVGKIEGDLGLSRHQSLRGEVESR